MTTAFLFDSQYCTGCKTCQVACKDKNDLAPGILWRRVYEITAGDWQYKEQAWFNTVISYNLSIACNHCEHPKCAGVCPTNAYTILPNGLVILNSSLCLGCGYCAWACPYGAPQYVQTAGVMTKCDFCVDLLEKGLPPACVSACPMRSLDYTNKAEDIEKEDYAQQVPPLPDSLSRNPRLLIKPHQAVEQMKKAKPVIANREEVTPRMVGRFAELPLVAFTLLAQLAVGAFWGSLFLKLQDWKNGFGSSTIAPWLLLPPGVFIFLALFLSFFHLGNPRNAWRAISHLQKSWLSREVLFSTLFAILWLILVLLEVRFPLGSLLPFWLITGSVGLLAIHAMYRVYRLHTSPTWDTWQTGAAFLASTILLGYLWTWSIQVSLNFNNGLVSSSWLFLVAGVLFLPSLRLCLSSSKPKTIINSKMRLVLILMGIGFSIVFGILYKEVSPWQAWIIFLIVLVEEILGRMVFYKDRTRFSKEIF